MLTDFSIRAARDADHPALVALWERSVRATHDFLSEADIRFFAPLVSEALRDDTMELWVLVDAADVPQGFMGIAGNRIEALFLEPDARRRGFGRRLVAHAQTLRPAALSVDVNEQNEGAREFYRSLGFDVVGRSAIDDTGRPFPVLHLERCYGQGAFCMTIR